LAVLRLFAAAREAAGSSAVELDAATVGDVLALAVASFGDRFADILAHSRVWLNGEPTDDREPVGHADVVAVLPPVSGGADDAPSVLPGETGLTGRFNRGEADAVGGSAVPAIAPAVPAMEPYRRVLQPPTLAVVNEVRAPHGRLGLAWAAVTLSAAWGGQGWLAVWLAANAALAALTCAHVGRARGDRPNPLLAGAGAGGLVLAAASGMTAMTAVTAAVLVAVLVGQLFLPTRRPTRDAGLTLAAALPVGLAAAAPVLLRGLGLSPVLVLLAFAAAYDAGAYLVGTGASSTWEGPVAGAITVVPITMVVAVALVPPFRGASPFLLGGLAAITAPLGPLAASALLGDPAARAPALRRLDSLLILGPLWAWCAAALIGR
jgi:molybdopterin synthase sulfur carrier subunit